MTTRRRSCRTVRSAAAVALAALWAACGGRQAETPVPGPGSSSFEWAGLRLEVELVSSPSDRLRAQGTLTNVADGVTEREVPRCVVMLRVYRRDRRVWGDGQESGCFGIRPVRLRPGESETFRRTVPAARILGDTLPAGRYLVRAFWPATTRPGLPRAEIEVTLGAVELETR